MLIAGQNSAEMQTFSELFKANEVDLATFQTLNEMDLKEIGVSAFGARRKMLLCISGENQDFDINLIQTLQNENFTNRYGHNSEGC